MSSKPASRVAPLGIGGQGTPSIDVLAALRESEGRLAVVLERLHDLVLYETGGGREFISSNVVHLLGYTAQELTADRNAFPALIHPEDREPTLERVRRWHGQGSVGVLMTRFRVRRRDGEWLWVEDRMIKVTPPAGKDYMTGVLVDVTRQKGEEERIRAAEERSVALLSALPDCIFLMDREGTYLDYHAPEGARLAARPEEFLGRKMSEVMVGIDVATHERLLQRALDERAIQLMVYENGPAEDRRHYEVRMVPCGENRVLSIVRDVTSRRRAEAAHQESLERQRLILSELDHRLRNNLAALVSLIDVTARDEQQSVDQFATTLRSRVRAMASVHTLLSKVQGSAIRLGSLIRSIVPPDLAHLIDAQGPLVRVSPRQAVPLAMVIQELVFNAIKYGALGSAEGRVEVEWQIRGAGVSAGDVHVEFRWRERGGPPPAQAPRLGAGASLVTGLVSTELRGRIDFSYPRTGAEHLLTMALDRG